MKFLWAFSSLMLVALACSAAQALVTVQTTDGRVITGEVDEETDNEQLWIRQEQEEIMLATAIDWSEVLTATQDGETLPNEQLPELLIAQATSEQPLAFVVQPAVYTAPKLPPRVYMPQVRSLVVEAYLVNLDRDVEPDGIELIVAALDEHGVPVTVKGNLHARLWGERIQPHGSLVRYEVLQQWTQPVAVNDFFDGAANYDLRFRTVRPAFDLGLHSEALLTVRLGVFGQGNFAASVPVQIRQFIPFRDRLQLTTGGRYLPDELTQEVRHQLPLRSHTRQLNLR